MSEFAGTQVISLIHKNNDAGTMNIAEIAFPWSNTILDVQKFNNLIGCMLETLLYHAGVEIDSIPATPTMH